MPPIKPDPSSPRRFDIALSFPGEYREIVAQVAQCLAARFGKDRVLYDHHHDAEFARLDLNVYLPNLYRKESELIVLFLCPEYANKLWCRLEWRHISQLIATLDAKRIMLLSFGDPGDLSDLGILAGDGYLDIKRLDAHTVADKIMERLSINQGARPPDAKASSHSKIDINDIITYGEGELIGREDELKILDDAWEKVRNGESNRPHVLSFIALGGEGKTSLVAKWAAGLAYRDWPGCEFAFARSFYRQGTREHAEASAELFFREALGFFGDQEFADSARNGIDKGRRLAQLVGQKRALLILDGIEPLQYAPTSPTPGKLKDAGLDALLKGLAAQSRGLFVLTSRYSILDLRTFWQTTAPEVKLTRLSPEAAIRLLESLGVHGSRKEFEDLVEHVKGHALTLNLLGTYLDANGGDIRKRDLVNFEEADAEVQGGHAFRVMDAYVKSFESEGDKGKQALAIMRIMGLFDRPADAGCLEALLKAPAIPDLTEALVGLKETQRNLIFKRLENAKLITVNRDKAGTLLSLDAHPLIREYFAAKLRTQMPESWRAAHRRLFEYLCESTEDKPQPTLEDLQPLYQAVAHGCQAGMQQETCEKVYRDRILRGTGSDGFYSTNKLGAFGADLAAAACFFDECWSRVSDVLTQSDQSWLLNEAALRLCGLGRLGEALEPMRSGLEMDVKHEDWKNAAQAMNNLSELELTLGELAQARAQAKDSVRHTERSGDAFLRMVCRTTHADALHQSGRGIEAQALFDEAEKLQAEDEPETPLLYSLGGFRYCDLLLASAEGAAWQVLIDPNFAARTADWLESCHAVSDRALNTLIIAIDNNAPLLTVALDHLTLARAALYTAILEKASLDSCVALLDQAVHGLRRAGTQDDLPRGLLTHAWLRFLQSNPTGPNSAQSDLDEAYEIAERGPMPLFIADILLHRARLFGLTPAGRGQPYPWTSASAQQDLAEARRLIEKHGYHRRQPELEDALRSAGIGERRHLAGKTPWDPSRP
ncbi:MAG: hypothetical protein ACRER2_09530 [Methylococcales bacterium]